MAELPEATRHSILTSEALNLLGVLAVPRAYAHWREQSSPEEMFSALQERMPALVAACERAEGGPDALRFREAAPRIRAFAELLAGTSPERFAETEWGAQARTCLDALGLEAPPGGWEAFDPASS